MGKIKPPRTTPDTSTVQTLEAEPNLEAPPVEETPETPEAPEKASSLGIDDGKYENISRYTPFPKPPSPRMSTSQRGNSDAIYSYLSQIYGDTSMRPRALGYFYRTWPRISREEGQKYIDVINEPINDDWIFKRHGSGEYLLILTDSGAPQQQQMIGKFFIKLDDPDYPPILNLGELDVGYKGNKKYVERLIGEGKLTPEGDVMPVQQGTGIGNDALIGLLREMVNKLDSRQMAELKKSNEGDGAFMRALDMMREGNKAAMEMMLAQYKSDSPDKIVTLITALLPIMQPKQDTGLHMLEFMKESQKTERELLLRLLEKSEKASALTPQVVQNGDSDKDEFDTMLDRMEKFKNIFGVVGGGKQSTLETIMQYGAPVLAKGFEMVTTLLSTKMRADAAKAAQGGAGAGGAPTAQPGGRGVVSAAPAATAGVLPGSSGAGTGANLNPAAEPDPGAEPKTMEELMQEAAGKRDAEMAQAVLSYFPMIKAAINRRTPGDVFANSIDTMFGPESGIVGKVQAYGLQGICDMIQKYAPEVWAGECVPMGDRFEIFLKEFCEYDPDAPEDEEEEKS